MFLHPLGLLALIAVPAVIGLHLFRRRFQPRIVSAVFLWAAQDRSSVAGRKREPLHTNPSFWCEVLAALLLALAFSGLRLFGAGKAGHLVVVLDSSASMASALEDGSLTEVVRTFVRGRIDDLPRGSRVTLVESGHTPELLVGPVAFTREAVLALDTWQPSSARHSLAPAIALAQQLAGEGAVLLVTDHFTPELWPEMIEVVALGERTPNFAITHATRRRAVDEESGNSIERIDLSVSSFADDTHTLDVQLVAAGAPLDTRRLTLEPGARKHIGFRLPANSPVIEVRLPDDALSIDNVAWLAPEPPRTLALASTLPEDLSVYLGLMSPGQDVSNIDRWLDLVPDSIDVKKPGAAHVLLSQTVPGGNAWCLTIPEVTGEHKALIGPFLIDKQSELLRGVTLEGIVWSASPATEIVGSPLVTAGDLPLVTEGRIGDRLVLQANIDPRTSSLHRSPDWPILLSNLAEMRRRELPGPARASLSIGETFVYRDRKESTYALEGPAPSSTARALRALGTLAVEGVSLPGVYTLSRTTEETRTELCQVAFSFNDPIESDLRDASTGERAGQASAATLLAGFTWLEILLLAGTLGLIALDWYVLSGKRKPRAEGA